MTQIISIAQRHKYILDKLKKDGYIRVADIAKSLKVTAVTVRKDFKALEEQGLLFRTHGSACPVNPHVADRSVQLKELENRVQKEKIAQAATQLLEENDSVIIATGSTIMAFAEKIGAKKIGIATCVGLLKESRTLAAILRKHGFEVYGVACKAGTVPKTEVGIPEECCSLGKNMCNPILQAKILNAKGTQLNVMMGLCVGHDSLFYKYSEALTTTGVTKDRVLGHNPVAALYTAESYYQKLL